jgi:2,5-diketo-D-gluconate reductase A
MTITTKSFAISSGVQIPAVGFGTYLIPSEQASEAVQAAIAHGYRHIDTAQFYQNEKAVGDGIKAALANHGLSRNEIFVTTKLWPGYAGWNDTPKNTEQTHQAFIESFEKLDLGPVDLYLIHSAHGEEQRIPQWRALVELKQQGKVRSIGVSNYSQRHIEEIRSAGLPLPDANQIELHPWSQKPELIAYLRENNILPIAYSSLAPLSTWRVGQGSAKTEAMQEDDVLKDMALKYEVTEAQLLLKWGVQNGYPVLPKSLNPERIKQNIDLDGFEISAPDMAILRKLDRGNGLAWSVGDPTLIA